VGMGREWGGNLKEKKVREKNPTLRAVVFEAVSVFGREKTAKD